jgi:hypothetical protein
MKVSDLVRYDPKKGCFVLKDNTPPKVLNPWEELAQVDRPSIFLLDPYFRAKTATGTVKSEEGLGYKQFGTYTRAKERIPNKHEKTPDDAPTKTPRAVKGTIRKNV